MILVDEIKNQIQVMLHPSENIKSMNVGEAIFYYYKIMIIPLILYVIMSLVFKSYITSLLSALPSSMAAFGPTLFLVFSVLEFLIGYPIGILITAGLVQFIGKNLLKILKGEYSDTVSALTYSSSVIVLVVWLGYVPILGTLVAFIFDIWSLIVCIIGLAKLNKTSGLAAFGALVATAIIVGIVIVVFIAILLGGFGALRSPSGAT